MPGGNLKGLSVSNLDADIALRKIAERLKLVRPLVIIDLETTGVSPELDRIVQVAYIQVEPNGSISQASSLVNPGIPIPPAATAVHHIKDSDVIEAPPFARMARAIANRLSAAEVVSGFNVAKFDLPMLVSECARAGVMLDADALTVIDAQGIFFRREPRSLEAAMRQYCGVEHQGGHDALIDVEATARVLAAQLDRYSDMPATVGALAEYSANRPPDALDNDGKIVWRDGAARLSFGKWAGTDLREIDHGYLDWMSRQQFSRSTKAIIRAAMNGEYPTGPRVAA